MLYRRVLIMLVSLVLLAGCKKKKKQVSLSGEDPVESGDFIAFFQPLSLPITFNDSVFLKKDKDSLRINYAIFTQFVPDSIIAKVFGKGIKPSLYPAGRVEVAKAETYLFAKAIAGDNKAMYVLAFDKDEKFITGIPLLWPPRNSTNTQSLGMDRKFALTRSVTKKNPDGSSSEGKDVYVLNADAKNFMLIMTDALDDRPTELVNPIDTLARKNKMSGDYTNGKWNIVSIRDGSRPDLLRFFIHIEKNNGECTGELRGEAKIRTSQFAEYRKDGDPCIMEFRFSSNSVTLKETGCGTYRSLRCLFDGKFPRKKEPNQPTPKKRTR